MQAWKTDVQTNIMTMIKTFYTFIYFNCNSELPF